MVKLVFKNGWKWWLVNLPKDRYKRLMKMIERLHEAGKLPPPNEDFFDVWS